MFHPHFLDGSLDTLHNTVVFICLALIFPIEDSQPQPVQQLSQPMIPTILIDCLVHNPFSTTKLCLMRALAL
jgi:hypothetical protein